MNSTRNQSLLQRLFRPVCLLFSIALLLTAAVNGQVKRHAASQAKSSAPAQAQAASGFLPGPIGVNAGDGSIGGTFADGFAPTDVSIGSPAAVASDSQGNIFIAAADATGLVANVYVIYGGRLPIPPILAEVTTQASPSVTPVQGKIYQVMFDGGISGNMCSSGCYVPGVTASQENEIYRINSLWFDSSDNLYLADGLYVTASGFSACKFHSGSYVVYEVNHSDATVNAVAGTVETCNRRHAPMDNIPATSALLTFPTDAKTDAFGNLYIVDSENLVVMAVYSGSQPPPVLIAEGRTADLVPGNLYTIAGTAAQVCDLSSCADPRPANGSLLAGPYSVEVDAAGNVYFADFDQVKVIYAASPAPPLLAAVTQTPTRGTMYTIAGTNNADQNCAQAPCGDGGPAAAAQFKFLTGLNIDEAGNVYLADVGDYAIRKIDASGVVSTISGIDDPNQVPPALPTVAANGSSTDTALLGPATIGFDPQGNLYIADGGPDQFPPIPGYNIVWKVSAAESQSITFPALDSPVDYGIGPILLNATASSSLAVQYSVSHTSPAIVNGSSLVITGAGTVDVTASQPGNAEFGPAAPITQHITVTKAPLTVTANDASKTFGQPNPAFSGRYSGFVNGDTAASALSGQPAFSTTANTQSDVGTYPITVAQGSLSANNYSFSFVNGTLTVSGATAQTITFTTPQPTTYGQAKTVALTASASSGLPITYTVASGPGRISGSTLTILGGGSIVITASQNGNNTYAAASPISQTLTVAPAPLTVTAPNLSLTYGTAINPASFPAPAISGFVGTDSAALVTGAAQFTTNATSTSNAGNYTLTVGIGSLALVPGADANYTLANFVPGKLTITPLAQTISYRPLSAATYGTLLNLTTTASSGLPVSCTFTGPISNGSGPCVSANNTILIYVNGVGSASITLSQAGSNNYTSAAPVVVNFSISPAPLTILAYPPQTREQGAANPTFPFQIQGFVNGDTDIPAVLTGLPELTTTADRSSPPGTYPIVISQGTLAAPNYNFIFVNGTLTVTPPGSYTMTANPPSLTIARGQSAQASITITPANLYQGTVTLNCGQLPANVSCIVSPATYTFPGAQNPDGSENPALGVVTISTTAGTIVGATRGGNSSLLSAGLLIPGAIASLFLVLARRRATKAISLWRLCSVLALALGISFMSSCGGSTGVKTAAPGTSTITLNGTGTTPSGNASVTVSIPLNITIQ